MIQRLVIYTILILYYSLSVISVKMSPCAKWNKTGITAAGTGEYGSSNNQLFGPEDIFIHNQTNVFYVADLLNYRIQMFSLDKLPSDGITVISTETSPKNVFVDDDDDGTSIYVSVPYARRVEKWIKNASSTFQVGDNCSECRDVSVDREKNVYITDYDEHCVRKWSPRSKITTIVAGQKGKSGNTDEFLQYPSGIYVDQNTGSVFVADTGNHRIQKWPKDSKKGITVAGSSDCIAGEDAASLWHPLSVFVDEQTQVIYVIDWSNHRIQRWLPDAVEGETIAGGFGECIVSFGCVSSKRKVRIDRSGSGNATNQLWGPTAVAFDNEGNLYACDQTNHRIQMFKIIDNDPCPATSTVNTKATPSTIGTTTTTTITTIKSRAASSHHDRYCVMILSMGMALSIVQCIIMIHID